jgi:(S)-2-hydroxyglutarate dehydrogenase
VARRARTVVVGAGIVGLATAREVLLGDPEADLLVVERELVPGRHQTSHNSGVIHAGIYYKPGSVKAQMCVQGAAAMRAFCEEHDIPVVTGGKLVVAASPEDLPGLDELERRGTANGVPGMRRVGPEEMREIEPHVVGVGALHSPMTAAVDFAAVTSALHADIERRGGRVRLGFPVEGIRQTGAEVQVIGPEGEVERATRVVACAGLQSDRLASSRRWRGRSVAIIPFRGSYYDLAPQAAERVRSAIYPVPDPRFPFLGVHFTRHVDQTVSCGPNAVLALAREKYRRTGFEAADVAATLTFPGFWRMAARHLRTGAVEVADDLSRRRYLRAARRYLPDLELADLRRGMTGIRAQAVDRAGRILDDFAMDVDGRTIHLLNAPSPGATSSLSIGRWLVDQLDRVSDP